MGTNFYVDADPTCDNPAHTEQLHIGKRSAGWKFGFQGYPDRGLTSWQAWVKFLVGRRIVDEYGTECPIGEFAEMVESRQMNPSSICRVAPTDEMIKLGWGSRAIYEDGLPYSEVYHDEAGYDFMDQEFC